MKKVIFAIVTAMTFTFAQGNVVTSGDNLISVGFNLDNLLDGEITPGAVVAWDHGVSFAKSFTFGAQAGVGFNSNGVSISPSFRAGYHPFAMPVLQGKVRIAPVFDPYVTMGLGTSLWIGDGTDLFNGIYYRGAIGCHWMFAEKIGLWGEIGTDFVAGITFKL
jgi:hypothetical protein